MKRKWMIVHYKKVWVVLDFEGYTWSRKLQRWRSRWSLNCYCSTKEQAQQHIACLRAA